jgi:predicted HTH transcriptional regulator
VDLFSADIEKIALTDVENFLAIGSPEEGRPSEGIKIDYKAKVPDDLCDTVAAFANTAGGLIFLGVESQKKKNNIPTKIVGVTFAGGDARAALTGKITSQVLPRPDVVIGIVDLPSGDVVVVLRVREGTYPPYQFTHGDKIRFPIRVQDTNKMCTLRDLEQMFEKCTRRSKNRPRDAALAV